jgi:glyoxylase-like metal-dependent hydrolase (beta-lactamase superfamily II)
MAEIASRIRRVGSQSLVNAYLVEEGGEVTIVDAGAPGLWKQVVPELAAMGRGLDDVRAIVLTHGHSDHVGFAERARRERGWPVWVHEVDAALARGEVPNPAAGGGSMRVGPMLRFGWWALRHGLFRVPHLGEVSAYGDGATLDVPGAPRVIHVPGHTPGSAALHFAGHDALFVGDAMCTYAVSTGRPGPQVAPFSADTELALASLARLEGVGAALVLPGHGGRSVAVPPRPCAWPGMRHCRAGSEWMGAWVIGAEPQARPDVP